MIVVVLQMASLIACGMIWRIFLPAGADLDASRRTLTGLVYNLLLPALILSVLWKAPLNLNALRVAIVAAVGVLSALALARLIYHLLRANHAAAGAMLLAAAFPNVTYLGLPVLEKAMGPWARAVAIQYDLFACTPLLLTAGILVARRYGHESERGNPLRMLANVPPVWAAIVGVLLNATNVALPAEIESWLMMLAAGVVPLMLIALGMALKVEISALMRFSQIIPVILIQLILMPLLAIGTSALVGLTGEWRIATILEAAMPSMVLGVVFCDRYGLDTSLYATAVTVTTLLSLITLPLWYYWLT